MGYGDYCLLLAIRDASANGHATVAQIGVEFPQSMLATAIRRKLVDASDTGEVNLTEHGRAAIDRFHIDKAAEWGWKTDATDTTAWTLTDRSQSANCSVDLSAIPPMASSNSSVIESVTNLTDPSAIIRLTPPM